MISYLILPGRIFRQSCSIKCQQNGWVKSFRNISFLALFYKTVKCRKSVLRLECRNEKWCSVGTECLLLQAVERDLVARVVVIPLIAKQNFGDFPFSGFLWASWAQRAILDIVSLRGAFYSSCSLISGRGYNVHR